MEHWHLPGDIQVVAHVKPLTAKYLPKLTRQTILIVQSDRDPTWLEAANEPAEEERGNFTWVRGPIAKWISFAARESFVDNFTILDEGGSAKPDPIYRTQWMAVRITFKEPTAGLTGISMASMYVSGQGSDWETEHWQRFARKLINNSVRLVVMGSFKNIRVCGETLVQMIREQGVIAEHIGEGFNGKTQLVMLGENCGYKGALDLTPAVAGPTAKPFTRAQWKKAVLKTNLNIQDTLNMPLPPIKTKYALVPQSYFVSVWLVGGERRTEAARAQRADNRAMRMQRVTGRQIQPSLRLVARSERRERSSSSGTLESVASGDERPPWRKKRARRSRAEVGDDLHGVEVEPPAVEVDEDDL